METATLHAIEDFFYEGEKIVKGTPINVSDAKLLTLSRSGIVVKSEFVIEGKTMTEWIDIGIVFPMKDHFVLPRGTNEENIEKLRSEKISEEDKNLYETWKQHIENGESHKVIKSMSTRMTSEKFGI